MHKVEARAIAGINDLNAYVEALKKALDNKVDEKQFDKVLESQKSFCTYDDLKDLYKKTVPALEKFQTNIDEIS